MPTKKPTDYFDETLAKRLAENIATVYAHFDHASFVNAVATNYTDKSLKQRVELIADQLHSFLPDDYQRAVNILIDILGPENEEETGMFTRFYWVMPVAKYVEKYGLEHLSVSMTAIEEITKRNTGEYAIRPFIRTYPDQTLEQMKRWAVSENFHLRRLASEGLRPKLPWATKLDVFTENPQPVFDILNLLKEDPVHFVKKSVANHVTDYLKVNPEAAADLIEDWSESSNEHTRWILHYATRKQRKKSG